MQQNNFDVLPNVKFGICSCPFRLCLKPKKVVIGLLIKYQNDFDSVFFPLFIKIYIVNSGGIVVCHYIYMSTFETYDLFQTALET